MFLNFQKGTKKKKKIDKLNKLKLFQITTFITLFLVTMLYTIRYMINYLSILHESTIYNLPNCDKNATQKIILQNFLNKLMLRLTYSTCT